MLLYLYNFQNSLEQCYYMLIFPNVYQKTRDPCLRVTKNWILQTPIVTQCIIQKHYKSTVFYSRFFLKPHMGLRQDFHSSLLLHCCSFLLWEKPEPLWTKTNQVCGLKIQFSSCGSTNRRWSFAIQTSSTPSVIAFQILFWLYFLHMPFSIFLICYVVTLIVRWTLDQCTDNFYHLSCRYIESTSLMSLTLHSFNGIS